jgi:hypothetical protein
VNGPRTIWSGVLSQTPLVMLPRKQYNVPTGGNPMNVFFSKSLPHFSIQQGPCTALLGIILPILQKWKQRLREA